MLMFSKRHMLASLLYHSRIINIARKRAREALIVLNYHRLWPGDHRGSTPFDSKIFELTQEKFYTQLKWIKKKFNVISEKELRHALNRGKTIDGPAALITFDDAYKDFYDLAYPIMTELGIPALLFVPADLISTRTVGWTDMIAYVIKKTEKTYLEYHGAAFSLGKNRDAAIRFFQRKMAVSDYNEVKGLPSDLAKILSVGLPAPEEQDKQLMTWDEIRLVREKNVSIGSHTCSHRVLSTLEPGEQEEELSRSKMMIETETGGKVYSIAYPIGDARSFDASTLTLAQKAGYELGFSYSSGINIWPDIEKMAILRNGVEESVIINYCKCFFPEIFVR